MVVVLILLAGAFLWFFFSTAVGALQEAMHPGLASEFWVTTEAYAAFAFANNFLTSFWTYLFAFVVIVTIYFVYIYSQRQGAGYQ